jgi:hypothetical protein
MKNFYPFLVLLLLRKLSAIVKAIKSGPVTRFLFFVIPVLAFVFIAGCHSFYKVKTIQNPQSNSISSLPYMNKNFVIHSDSIVFVMNNIAIGNDSIKGNYVGGYKFPFNRYSFPEPNSTNRYWNRKGDGWIINEVHFYIQNLKKTILPGITQCSFAVKDINRLDVYDKDKVRTTFSWIVGIVGAFYGGLLAFYGFLFLIIALSGGSCPYVYVNNGNDFVFAGEIYSGAIYAPLERDDYLLLPGLVSEDGNYLLKMSNELHEVQHTNLTELLVFDHPANMQVLVDKYGHYQTAVEKKPPLTATNFMGTNILDIVRYKDSVSYCGVPPNSEIPLTDGVIMTFDLPEGVDSGKLFIRARNSIWLDHVFKEFHSMLGGYQDTWTKNQNNSDPKKFIDWSMNQKIPLSVYIEKNGKWAFCDYFQMAGPMALKDDVLALDLKGISEGPLKIKLESGHSFWEIDYAVMDYSNNYQVRITNVSLDKAVTEDGENVSGLLNRDDSEYYIQPENDNVADLSFSAPAITDSGRTIILHSKGYYQINQESKGIPRIAKLNQIRKPGQFLEYSRDLMKAAIKDLYEKEGLGLVTEPLGNE